LVASVSHDKRFKIWKWLPVAFDNIGLRSFRQQNIGRVFVYAFLFILPHI
jgi:hypothetical protein